MVEIKKFPMEERDCLLGNDIGMYSTYGQEYLYCHANYDRKNSTTEYEAPQFRSTFADRGII